MVDLETLDNLPNSYPTMANPTGPLSQNLNEYIVASVLWDLANNTLAEDPLALDFSEILAALGLPHSKQGAGEYNLVDLLDSVFCAGLTSSAELNQLVAPVQLPYQPPTSCP